MVVGIARLPAVVYQATRANKLTAGGNIDVVTHRMHRNDPFRFAVFRTEHHSCPDRVGGFLDINLLTVDGDPPCGNAGTPEQAFH